MLSLIQIKDIHQCEDTDHVYVIFRTSPWATHVVCAGDLTPASTMLVTPVLHYKLTSSMLIYHSFIIDKMSYQAE